MQLGGKQYVYMSVSASAVGQNELKNIGISNIFDKWVIFVMQSKFITILKVSVLYPYYNGYILDIITF